MFKHLCTYNEISRVQCCFRPHWLSLYSCKCIYFLIQVFSHLHATGAVRSMVRMGAYSRCRTSHRGTPVANGNVELSCFFVSASTSQWISALYPYTHIIFSWCSYCSLVLVRALSILSFLFSLRPVFLNALLPFSLPHVISRMGKSDTVDISLFCLVAIGFLPTPDRQELDRRGPFSLSLRWWLHLVARITVTLLFARAFTRHVL